MPDGNGRKFAAPFAKGIKSFVQQSDNHRGLRTAKFRCNGVDALCRSGWDLRVHHLAAEVARSLLSSTTMTVDAVSLSSVLVLPFSDGRNLAIAFDGIGWRFHTWRDHDGTALPNALSALDRTRRFESPDSALEYFRAMERPSLSVRKAQEQRRLIRLAS